MEQHYIPQFYLRGFCDPGTPAGQEPWVWVADLDERTVRRRAPQNVGYATDYYALPPGQDIPANAAEEALQRIESAAAPVVRKLLAGDFQLSDQEWAALQVFMAFLAIRVPAFRNNIEGFMGRIGSHLMKLMAGQPGYLERTLPLALGRECSEQEIEDVRQSAYDDTAYTLRGSPTYSLGMGMKMAEEGVGPLFSQMRWQILRAAVPARFVTSDCPVSWFDPTPRPAVYAGHGLGMSKVEVSFPLSPTLCLFGTWQEPTALVNYAKASAVDILNRRRIVFAERYVFADTEQGAGAAISLLRQYGRRRD